MSLPTLLDIVKANGADAMVGLVDETIKAHPELSLAAARTIKGLQYKTLVRTALGNTTGSFRAANAGTAAIKHTYENRLVQTYILSPRFECDKAVADNYEDGPQVYIATENQGVMEGEMQGICRQFYYGTNATFGNASGFPGLLQAHDANNMVVDATGTSDNVCSSVWLVKFGPKDVQWVWGANGQFAMSPVRVESLTDPADATKKFPGYVSDMSAYPGLQVGSLMSVVRIKKLTTDNGKGLTDALLADAMGLFPAGMVPDVILMSRRSRAQLQTSRSVTIYAGPREKANVQKIASLPTEYEGVPIQVSDAISNIETLTL